LLSQTDPHEQEAPLREEARFCFVGEAVFLHPALGAERQAELILAKFVQVNKKVSLSQILSLTGSRLFLTISLDY